MAQSGSRPPDKRPNDFRRDMVATGTQALAMAQAPPGAKQPEWLKGAVFLTDAGNRLRLRSANQENRHVNRPRIAFCTTCKNRTQHLRQTLPKNLADNAGYENAVFVVLDYGSEDDLCEYIYREHGAELKSGRLALYHYHTPGKFHMAHAKNMAHRCGMLEGADILVNLDADNLTTPGFAQYLADQFAKNDRMFMWSRMIRGQFRRGISGRIACTPTAFLLAGGYDEKYSDWGPDDK